MILVGLIQEIARKKAESDRSKVLISLRSEVFDLFEDGRITDNDFKVFLKILKEMKKESKGMKGK